MRMSAARAIVEVMVREGVEKAFCVPGESYLTLLNELYDHPQIELISGRHEGGVSFMAEGYAKASGKTGVCLATRGPGATNLSIGLHTANQDSTPLVAFIGQVERGVRGREGFQEIDLAEYFSHLVKWTVELREAARVPELVQRAFHIAKTGRPGPVLVSLPQDVLDEFAEMQFQPSLVFSHPRPDREAVLRAKDLLQSAERPVIIAGGGITGTQSSAVLTKLAEKLKIPVVTAFRRFDAFPNQHPCYIGSLGLATPKYLTEAISQADVVLAVGTRFSQITSQNYTLLNPGSKLIHVDISPDEIYKVYTPTVGIVADVKQFLVDLLAEVTDQTNSAEVREPYISQLRQQYVNQSNPRREYREDFVNLEGMVHDLLAEVAEDTILTSDAGNFFGWLARYYPFRVEGTYIGPTSGAMGYGLPSAIGAKLAKPDQTVIAFAGDGGFMMTAQELETAVRNRIAVIAIVVNNNMYGTIRMHQERKYPHRVIGTDLTNPNFAEWMKLLGGHGELVENNADFLPALRRALELKQPTVIEIKADSQQISVSKTINELRGEI